MELNYKKDACKVWFNPQMGWFQVYDPKGNELKFGQDVTINASVKVCDNFSKDSRKIGGSYANPETLEYADRMATATIELIVEVVNEEPKPL